MITKVTKKSENIIINNKGMNIESLEWKYHVQISLNYLIGLTYRVLKDHNIVKNFFLHCLLGFTTIIILPVVPDLMIR